MSTIYDLELVNARRDYLRDGHTLEQWKDSVAAADMTLRRLGFADRAEVRRLADKYGRRA